MGRWSRRWWNHPLLDPANAPASATRANSEFAPPIDRRSRSGAATQFGGKNACWHYGPQQVRIDLNGRPSRCSDAPVAPAGSTFNLTGDWIASWRAALDESVNKRLLSTGESRELVRGDLGSGLNPGG